MVEGEAHLRLPAAGRVQLPSGRPRALPGRRCVPEARVRRDRGDAAGRVGEGAGDGGDAGRPAVWQHVIGPPAPPDPTPATTWLRIVRREDRRTGEERYTGYSSIDGARCARLPA